MLLGGIEPYLTMWPVLLKAFDPIREIPEL